MPAPSESRPSRDDRKAGIVLVLAMAAVMWVLEVADLLGDTGLDANGVRPREADGLVGIAAGPFLHAGLGHLVANTLPFLALGAAIALGGLARVALVTAVVALVGGLGTWLTAAAGTDTIGASGLVFGYATYLVARAVWTRGPLHVVGALVVLAIYGTTLLVGLVPTPGVSWQAHLFGGVGGVVAARALHGRRRSAATRDGLPRLA